jgi:ornithine carbamoyltransferase
VGRADFPENSLIFIGAEPINITESHIVMMEELGITTPPVKPKQYGDYAEE